MARLAGVIETPGEHAACSLVFELETEGGGTVRMTYGQIMEALRFAQDEAIMPALSEHWWARTGRTDGCSLTAHQGASRHGAEHCRKKGILMKSDMVSLSPPDLWAVFEFQDGSIGQAFGVSLATLLQCLCIAEQRHFVPPFEEAWEAATIPPVLRAMSTLTVGRRQP
jgi:hypothetical protein